MKRTRYQFGSVALKKRALGPHVWVYRYFERSIRKSKMIGSIEQYPKRADALKCAESLRMLANPDDPSAQIVTLRALIDRYKTEELPELRHSTQLAYSSYLDEHIMQKWGDYPLGEVKPFAVEQWLKGVSLARRTKGNICNVMRVLFNAAMRWELMEIRENPMKLVRVRGVSKREKEPRVLDVPECHAVMQQLEEPYRTMVALALATGLRSSELFALKWRDFDWLNSTMFV